MSKALLGLYLLPAGVFAMCAAGLFQMYVVMMESYPLNRFRDRQLVWVVAAMFFSFSLALYWFCPNARRKGAVFLLLGGGGLIMYVLAKMWLPWQK
ncbi:MAG: hypothetical protein Q3966_09475 [Neisseria sp.]|nr:hypothetical protein [Neisseria sp.]